MEPQEGSLEASPLRIKLACSTDKPRSPRQTHGSFLHSGHGLGASTPVSLHKYFSSALSVPFCNSKNHGTSRVISYLQKRVFQLNHTYDTTLSNKYLLGFKNNKHYRRTTAINLRLATQSAMCV